MCWSCNAICGGCRPPRKRPVKCPECGAFNVFDIEKDMEGTVCASCGIDLTELAVPKPLLCKLCGEMCYNPCKKATTEPKDGLETCMMRVTEPLVNRM